eukprot:scpid96492/ scgid22196/ 
MEEERTPRQLVFSALLPTRPACGPRKRWRDALGADVRCLDLGDEEWFDLAQERSTWRGPYSSVPSSGPLPQPRTPCAVCGRSLSKSGMARHKCKEERSKPIADQIGSRKCPACKRWFRSAAPEASLSTSVDPTTIVLQAQWRTLLCLRPTRSLLCLRDRKSV